MQILRTVWQVFLNRELRVQVHWTIAHFSHGVLVSHSRTFSSFFFVLFKPTHSSENITSWRLCSHVDTVGLKVIVLSLLELRSFQSRIWSFCRHLVVAHLDRWRGNLLDRQNLILVFFLVNLRLWFLLHFRDGLPRKRLLQDLQVSFLNLDFCVLSFCFWNSRKFYSFSFRRNEVGAAFFLTNILHLHNIDRLQRLSL